MGDTVMDIRVCVVLLMLGGMVSGGVLNWLGMVDNARGLKHEENRKDKHLKKGHESDLKHKGRKEEDTKHHKDSLEDAPRNKKMNGKQDDQSKDMVAVKRHNKD